MNLRISAVTTLLLASCWATYSQAAVVASRPVVVARPVVSAKPATVSKAVPPKTSVQEPQGAVKPVIIAPVNSRSTSCNEEKERCK